MDKDLIIKAKQAKSLEELLIFAKENGAEITEESANAYFDQLHKTSEVVDDELDNVSGGALPLHYALNTDNYIHCPKCNSVNLWYNNGKERYECNDCKTAFTSFGIVKSGGCG